ncbi:MAG TPA: lipoyl(octanoyl) transferase LipB [Gammaproteobacteria bacterium]|jgi:lipoate-protein ligase B
MTRLATCETVGSEQSGSGPRRRVGEVVQQERLDYDAAGALQRRLVEDRIAGRKPDTLLLLEHEPVFTAGRTARAEHWGGDERASRVAGIPVWRTDRGGSVTYHGPGQLVGYPILKLNRFCEGPKAYVRMLEEVIIRTLVEWNIVGRRIEKLPGVWVGDEGPAKIAAIGTRIERGVTMHGFALNVTVNLAPFSLIVPCGLANCRVTSMAEALAYPVNLPEVRRCVAEQFADVFGLEWVEP